MKVPESQSKRKLLKLALSCFFATPFFRLTHAEPGFSRAAIIEKLKFAWDDQGGALRGIGEEYLKLVPQESNQRVLLDLISAEYKGSLEREIADAGVCELRNKLRNQILSDFNNGETTIVHGWLLSNTELRMCALCSLS